MSKLTKAQQKAVEVSAKNVKAHVKGGVVDFGTITSRSGRKWSAHVTLHNDAGKLTADLAFSETGSNAAEPPSYEATGLSGKPLRDFIKYRTRRLCFAGTDIKRIVGLFNGMVPQTVAEEVAEEA